MRRAAHTRARQLSSAPAAALTRGRRQEGAFERLNGRKPETTRTNTAPSAKVSGCMACYGVHPLSLQNIHRRGCAEEEVIPAFILFGGKQPTLTLCHLAGFQTTHYNKHGTTTHPGTGAHQPHTRARAYTGACCKCYVSVAAAAATQYAVARLFSDNADLTSRAKESFKYLNGPGS